MEGGGMPVAEGMGGREGLQGWLELVVESGEGGLVMGVGCGV